ncbi:alpha/beta hydrolase [Microbacterium sp. NPDC056052]|uniref:alpha/beta hydrolase n=1 Tax=Microbacterium sp. NPDC056052 TaxID=3345695 RepID=UPI0035D545C3
MSLPSELALDPGILGWITRIEEISPGLPGLTSRDPLLRRAAERRLSDLLAVDAVLPVPDGVDRDDLVVPGPRGPLRMRRYRPAGETGPLPSQLWLHGGGFFGGSADEQINERLCAHRTLDSGVQIFSLEYGLAPEHPYPAASDDAAAALEALIDGGARLGVDPTRVGIGGNSAGAAIAASTVLRLRGSLPLVHVDLEVPALALRPVGRAAEQVGESWREEFAWVAGLYVGPDGPMDSDASPLDADDLSGFPPTLIFVGEHDPLRDAGIAFAARLTEVGVETELVVGPGHLHGTPGLTAVFPGARAWQAQHAQELIRAYRSAPSAV